MLAAGVLGGVLPLRSRALPGGRLLGWSNAFAAGIFLGAGFIHMLPDAVEAGEALGWRYPLPYALAAAAFLLMLLAEHVLVPETAHEAVHAPSDERFAPLHARGGSALAAYAVLLALCVHSFLEGLALGAQPELAGAMVIFLAIMAHKSTSGLALGVSLVRNPVPRGQAWGLLALFAVATPIGIGAGALLAGALEGAARLAFEAVFLALAAGTFAYVATLDILRDEFAEPAQRWSKWLLVVAGCGLMALLALWI